MRNTPALSSPAVARSAVWPRNTATSSAASLTSIQAPALSLTCHAEAGGPQPAILRSDCIAALVIRHNGCGCPPHPCKATFLQGSISARTCLFCHSQKRSNFSQANQACVMADVRSSSLGRLEHLQLGHGAASGVDCLHGHYRGGKAAVGCALLRQQPARRGRPRCGGVPSRARQRARRRARMADGLRKGR